MSSNWLERRTWWGWLACLLVLAGVALPARAASRGVALVIGNAAYADRPLKNPANDARDLAAALNKAGFEVVLKQNLNADQMKEAIADFGDRLAKERRVGLFYFSGHGMQTSKGQNYLLPVGRDYKRERDVEFYAVEARSVLSQMEAAGNPLNIVVLDACRDAPLPAEARSLASKGLARMEAPSGSIIAFATAPGRAASDNPQERNGLYTKHLIAAIDTPGLRLEDVFKRVGRNVERESNGQQSPEEMMKLRDDTPFYFRLAQAAPAGGADIASLEREAELRRGWSAWQTRMRSDFDKIVGMNAGADLKVQAWERFLAGYPQKNPYGDEDERLRGEARSRKQAAEAERQTAATRPAATAVAVGQTFKDCAECPEMVVIPGGSFEMGGNDYNDEKPIHRVQVGGFALGKYEVTQGQWRALMGGNPSRFKDCGDDCPVEQVSWDDAQEYIRKLNARTGQRYRLASEAEWEYACRAGGRYKYCGGDDLAAVAWYESNSGNKTHRVGGKRANAWGLYDMSGNVWEWVEDCWHTSYEGAPTDGSAWTSGACEERVLRGASWGGKPDFARAAIRGRYAPGTRSDVIGFRIARTY